MRTLLPVLTALSLVAATLQGCGPDEEAPPLHSGGVEGSRAAEPPRGELLSGTALSVEERVFAFVGDRSASDDAALAVSWIFETRVHDGGEVRGRSLRIGSDDEWEPAVLDADTLPRTPVPGRILPGHRIRLLSSPEGAIEALQLRGSEGEPQLGVGIPLAQWTVPGLGAVRFHRGRMYRGDSIGEGFLLDLTRSARGDAPEPGGWIFVHGGNEFQLALSELPLPAGAPSPPEDRSRSHYRGWGRVAVIELQWDRIAGEWSDLRASERARRDIPMAWTFSTPDERVRGHLEVTSSELVVGEGDGPLLPVEAHSVVRGHFIVEEDSFAVTGIALHRRR